MNNPGSDSLSRTLPIATLMPVIPSAARNDWDAGQQRQRTLQLTNEAERAQRGTSVTEQATDAFAATPMKADLIERTNRA